MGWRSSHENGMHRSCFVFTGVGIRGRGISLKRAAKAVPSFGAGSAGFAKRKTTASLQILTEATQVASSAPDF